MNRSIDNYRQFPGRHKDAINIHQKLIERFPDEPHHRNQLAVTHLWSNKWDFWPKSALAFWFYDNQRTLISSFVDAKLVLHETLLRWRENGFAAAHYGFVLKIHDKNLENAAIFLRQGIDSGENGTTDGRFYFHLGDALARLGRTTEADEVHREGAAKNVFRSANQRSLYNVDHLVSRPFWTIAESGYKHLFRVLEDNWQRIRDEALSVLSEQGYFVDEAESLRDFGDWKQFELYARGQKSTKNCEKAPFTCKLIDTFPEARFCKRGQVKFSVMHPNTHVWPHCGPTNCRLRAHLGLKVPANTQLRVADERRLVNLGWIVFRF